MKPYKQWEKLPINWLAGFQPSTVSCWLLVATFTAFTLSPEGFMWATTGTSTTTNSLPLRCTTWIRSTIKPTSPFLSPFKPHNQTRLVIFWGLYGCTSFFNSERDILMYTFDEVLLDKFGSVAWSPLIDLPPQKRSILVNWVRRFFGDDYTYTCIYCTFTLVATIYFVAFSDEASLK